MIQDSGQRSEQRVTSCASSLNSLIQNLHIMAVSGPTAGRSPRWTGQSPCETRCRESLYMLVEPLPNVHELRPYFCVFGSYRAPFHSLQARAT